MVVSILFSIIPILPQYIIVVSILFSIIPIKPQYIEGCCLMFWPSPGILGSGPGVLRPEVYKDYTGVI